MTGEIEDINNTGKQQSRVCCFLSLPDELSLLLVFQSHCGLCELRETNGVKKWPHSFLF